MKALGNEHFCDEFMRGQKDCRSGIAHKPGQSEAYDRGYAVEYEAEQVRTWESERGLYIGHVKAR